ncbi:LysR family transcriptional regulator [Ruegeria sp. HKCCD8929]|uniref:LysR family transcriptional regulator n=1 Tax=Ruegeria sp. HKCCD8929 TaxID=2683006 RepID=UPI001488B7CC|nr:LysR family transcriptional regulator [Ruegeria sp. HKCCD8929]
MNASREHNRSAESRLTGGATLKPGSGLFPLHLRQCGQICFGDLAVLMAVAEAGSFRRASTIANLGQSSVTRRIQKIEDLLGVSLFERSPIGARLTFVGSRFVDNIRAISGDLCVAVRTAQSAGVSSNGQLRIGLIASLSLGALRELILTFVHKYPDVEISFTEADRSDLLTRLSHRELDVLHAAGCLSENLGDTLMLTQEPIYLALSDTHVLASKCRVLWSDVDDATFVVSTLEPGPEIRDYILRQVSNLGRQAKIQQHRLDREGIMNLVGLGLGISLVAEHWTGVAYPNVVFRRIGGDDERIPFSLTWRPENDNPALRRFLSLARVHAKAHAAPS